MKLTSICKYILAIILGFMITLTLLGLLSTPFTKLIFAQGTDRHVCLSGCPYNTIQAAVDAANPGDTIKIASGVYTHINNYGDGFFNGNPFAQIVYISKTLTLRGGYTTTDNFAIADPDLHPTILDAQNQGRVIMVTGNITTTIEGLYIQGGNANNLPGYSFVHDQAGGGIHLHNANITLINNHILNNQAHTGGGLYLNNFIAETSAVISGNIIKDNFSSDLFGGGLFSNLNTHLYDNLFENNFSPGGGGAYLQQDSSTLINNRFINNQANTGGGLYISSHLLLNRNVFTGNQANTGGGVYIRSSRPTLFNTLIANNQATAAGSGVYVYSGLPHFYHTTIAKNESGDGSGIYVNDGHIVLTNTILVSQTIGITVTDDGAATLAGTLWGSGPWANQIDWGGNGTIITGNLNLWADPEFADPLGGDYHLNASSPAIDVGFETSAVDDVDGDPRPASLGFDLGADERPGPSLRLTQFDLPALTNLGDTVTYTLLVVSAGISPTTNVLLTDTLPAQQRILNINTSRGNCSTVTTWGGQVLCQLGSMLPTEQAFITLTTQITTEAILPQYSNNVVEAKALETAMVTSNQAIILHNCHARLNDTPTPYNSVQDAINASATDTDIVKIAGYCVGPMNTYELVLVDRPLTLQGGWNVDFSEHNPALYPTTLDATRKGRVIYVDNAVTSTIEDLHIIHGDGSTAFPHFVYGLLGGGILVDGQTKITLTNNYIAHNYISGFAQGAGVAIESSKATLISNTIAYNVASDSGSGGGVSIIDSDITFIENNIISNAAASSGGGIGDGSWISYGNITLISNTIAHNQADRGGGIATRSDTTSVNNFIISNTANSNGGGISLAFGGDKSFNNDKIIGNTALTGNGGGIAGADSQITATNLIIAKNQAGNQGSGLYITGAPARLYHTTIAQNNQGGGIGIHVGNDSQVYLTNTILVSHTLGVTVSANSTATLAGTLWGRDSWGNLTDWAGSGTILTSTYDLTGSIILPDVNIWDIPNFTNPDANDYHLALNSVAIDNGIHSGVLTDMDGETRPSGPGYDLGADEYLQPLTNSAPDIPHTPNPANGANDVPLSQYLNWQSGDLDGGPITYTVAFGVNNPPPVIDSTTLISYFPALTYNTTYYWSISATDGLSVSVGPIWAFTTTASSPPASLKIYLPLINK